MGTWWGARAAAVVVIAMMSGGCFQHDLPPDPCVTREGAALDPTGARWQYVVNHIGLPTTAAKANELALNLDGDPQGRGDNALGQIISTINHQLSGIDLDEEVQTLVDAGALLHLIDLQATSLGAASGVGVTVLHGLDTDGDPTDNFSGSEIFAIDRSRGQGLITGDIEEGSLRVELGDAPIAVTFPGLGEPFILHLSLARIEATFTATGIEGIIAGALSETEVETGVLPVLYEGLRRMVERDCDEAGCCCFGETLLRLFDEDGDGAMTLEEFRDSSLVSSLLAPDVDLLDTYGEGPDRIAPRCDGVKDHLSVGIGFTAVPALIASGSAP